VGVGWFARHLGDDGHLVGRGSEHGLEAAGDARADATDGRLLAPAVEALPGLVSGYWFLRVFFGGVGGCSRLVVSVRSHRSILAGFE
jgi:hypothetical protein